MGKTCLILMGEPRTWDIPDTLPALDPFVTNPIFLKNMHGKIDVIFYLKKSIPLESIYISQNTGKTTFEFDDSEGNLVKGNIGEFDTEVVLDNINNWREKFNEYINKLDIIWLDDEPDWSRPTVEQGMLHKKRFINIIKIAPYIYYEGYDNIFITRPDIIMEYDSSFNTRLITYPYGFINYDNTGPKKPGILFCGDFVTSDESKVANDTPLRLKIERLHSELVCLNFEFFKMLHGFLNLWFETVSDNNENWKNPYNYNHMEYGETFWPLMATICLMMSGDSMEDINSVVIGQTLIKGKINRKSV